MATEFRLGQRPNPKAGGRFGSVGPSRSGGTVAFHGTQARNVSSILKEGLRANQDDEGVWVTTKLGKAKSYAINSRVPGFKPLAGVVVKLSIPKFAQRFHEDEDDRHAYSSSQPVPPEEIVDILDPKTGKSIKAKFLTDPPAAADDAVIVYAVVFVPEDELPDEPAATEALTYREKLAFLLGNPHHGAGGRFSSGDDVAKVEAGGRYTDRNGQAWVVHQVTGDKAILRNATTGKAAQMSAVGIVKHRLEQMNAQPRVDKAAIQRAMDERSKAYDAVEGTKASPTQMAAIEKARARVDIEQHGAPYQVGRTNLYPKNMMVSTLRESATHTFWTEDPHLDKLRAKFGVSSVEKSKHLADDGPPPDVADTLPPPGDLYQTTFVRHGETELDRGDGALSGWLDVPLTDEGRVQAQNTADALQAVQAQGQTWGGIVSSPLARALETAKILAAALNLPLVTDDDLKPWDVGELAGKPYADVADIVQKLIATPNECAPGGNSLNELLDRYLPKIRAIRQSPVPLIVVSHSRNGSLLAADATCPVVVTPELMEDESLAAAGLILVSSTGDVVQVNLAEPIGVSGDVPNQPQDLGNPHHGHGGKFASEDMPSARDVEATHQALEARHGPYLSKLNTSGDTYQLLIAYASDFDYVKEVNGYLRTGHAEDPDEKEYANTIQNAILKAPKLQAPVTVFRGIGWAKDAASRRLVDSLANATPGTKVKLKGFQSTTIDPGIATGFTGKSGVILRIVAKQGLYLGGMDFNKTESGRRVGELLLAHDQTYTVRGRAEVKIGSKRKTVVDLEQR